MKIIYHYENKCNLCKNYGDEWCMCKICRHNNNYSYLAVNMNYTHYFNNEKEFHKFIRNNFGIYRTILPIDYFKKIEKINNFEID